MYNEVTSDDKHIFCYILTEMRKTMAIQLAPVGNQEE